MAIASERVVIRFCFFVYMLVALLSLALWGGFVHAAQTLNVTNHSMAIGITPYGMPISKIAWGGLAYDFSTEDEEAYVYIMNITLDERTTITAQWRFPNGSIYLVNEKTLDEGSHNVWLSINIRDYPAARVLGNWEVEVFADGTFLFTEEFIISQAPTFQWSTIFIITGIIIAAPILLTFSRMKKPPSKVSFALSLVGGLIIAISALLFGIAAGGGYFAPAMAFLLFLVIPLALLGIAVSFTALSRNWVVVLILSAISLLLYAFYTITYIDVPARYAGARPFLFCVFGLIGSVCGIFGGLFKRRKI